MYMHMHEHMLLYTRIPLLSVVSSGAGAACRHMCNLGAKVVPGPHQNGTPWVFFGKAADHQDQYILHHRDPCMQYSCHLEVCSRFLACLFRSGTLGFGTILEFFMEFIECLTRGSQGRDQLIDAVSLRRI